MQHWCLTAAHSSAVVWTLLWFTQRGLKIPKQNMEQVNVTLQSISITRTAFKIKVECLHLTWKGNEGNWFLSRFHQTQQLVIDKEKLDIRLTVIIFMSKLTAILYWYNRIQLETQSFILSSAIKVWKQDKNSLSLFSSLSYTQQSHNKAKAKSSLMIQFPFIRFTVKHGCQDWLCCTLCMNFFLKCTEKFTFHHCRLAMFSNYCKIQLVLLCWCLAKNIAFVQINIYFAVTE